MTVRNLLEKTQENVILTMNLPSEFEMKKAYMVGYEDDGITRKMIDFQVDIKCGFLISLAKQSVFWVIV